MQCFSIRQPWAALILYGPKRIENRSRLTRYRGPVLIHAGKTLDKRADLSAIPPGVPVHCGFIIGVAELVDCRPYAACVGLPYARGPWCWFLDSVRAFDKPIRWRGALSFFRVPDEVVADAIG
jgi:hypothetical protein